MGPSLEAIGRGLVDNGASWQDMGRIALEALAGVLRGLGEQAAAMAAIAFATGRIAAGGALAAASAGAFLAAGIISGLASKAGSASGSASDTAESASETAISDQQKGQKVTETDNVINLSVEMDSEPILTKVFKASQNGTVLIDARAVV